MAETRLSWAELPLDLVDRVMQALVRECETGPWAFADGPASLKLGLPVNFADDGRSNPPESSAKTERHRRRVQEAFRQGKRELRSMCVSSALYASLSHCLGLSSPAGTLSPRACQVTQRSLWRSLAATQVCRSWREAACRRTAVAELWLGCKQEGLQLALATLREFARRRPVLLKLTWNQAVSCHQQPAFVRGVAHLRELHLLAEHPGFLDFFVYCPALTSLVLRASEGFQERWRRQQGCYGWDPYACFRRAHQLYRAAGLEYALRAMPCLKQLTILGVVTPMVERGVDWTACASCVTRLSLQLTLWNTAALRLPRLRELKLSGCDFSRECAFLQGGCLPPSLTALSLERVMLEERPCFAHVRSLSLLNCRFRNRFRTKPLPRRRLDEGQQCELSCDDDSDCGRGGRAQRSEGDFWRGVCDLSLCTALTRLVSQDGPKHRQPHLRYLCGLPPGLRALHLEACFQGVDAARLLGSITAVAELDLHICCEERRVGYTGGCTGHRARECFPPPLMERLAELPRLRRLHLVFWEDPYSHFMSDEDVEGLGGYFRERYESVMAVRRYQAGVEGVRQAVVGRGGECVVQVGIEDYGGDCSGWDEVSSWDSEGGESKPAPFVSDRYPQELPSWALGRPAWCMKVEEDECSSVRGL